MQASVCSTSSSFVGCSIARRSTTGAAVRPARAARLALVAPRAEAGSNVTPPKGVTQPPVVPSVPPATFGFVENAERLNSRAAMIGFFALLLVEAVLGKGLLEAIGLTVGKGLGFEF